jgi:hypothetical protein
VSELRISAGGSLTSWRSAVSTFSGRVRLCGGVNQLVTVKNVVVCFWDKLSASEQVKRAGRLRGRPAHGREQFLWPQAQRAAQHSLPQAS